MWPTRAPAHAASCAQQGHDALVKTAVRLMPRLSSEDADAVRVAILAGPGNGLRSLVITHWVKP